jgi:hypothetical protein
MRFWGIFSGISASGSSFSLSFIRLGNTNFHLKLCDIKLWICVAQRTLSTPLNHDSRLFFSMVIKRAESIV